MAGVDGLTGSFADARTLGGLGSGVSVPASGTPVFDPPTTCTELISEDG